MKNNILNINMDSTSGGIHAIRIHADNYGMNWIDQGKVWGVVHCKRYDGIWGDYEERCGNMELICFEEDEAGAVSRYSNGILAVTVERYFSINGNLCERYTLKNTGKVDLFLEQDNFGIILPFSDRYTDAEDCMVNRCNTHIWCGHNTTYINAVKMGCSDANLGLVLTQGAIDSYSILNKKEGGNGNFRGEFLLHAEHKELLPDEEYILEWELFVCAGIEDFYDKIMKFDSYIGILAKHFTVFLNEKIELEIYRPKTVRTVRAYIDETELEMTASAETLKAEYQPLKTGKHRVWIEMDRGRTYADFNVALPLGELVEKRLR